MFNFMGNPVKFHDPYYCLDRYNLVIRLPIEAVRFCFLRKDPAGYQPYDSRVRLNDDNENACARTIDGVASWLVPSS